jgi:hypothetical protein
MQPAAVLVRSPSDRSLSSVFVPEPRVTHRPPTRYTVRLRNVADVDSARKAKVPLFLLTDHSMERLRFPMRFPPVLFAAATHRAAVDAPWIVMESTAPPSKTRDEDLITYLLKLDPLAARAILDRNVQRLDLDYLTLRITEERLNVQATRVRMQDRLPKLVTLGESLPKHALNRVLARNRPHRQA